MNIMLIKLMDVKNYSDWRKLIIQKLMLSDELSANLLVQLQERDRLGSIQVDEHVIMPHVVSNKLPKSWLIISQVDKPIKYGKSNDITTGIYIFSRPKDSSISSSVDCLTDEWVMNALQNPKLSYQQLMDLLRVG